VAAVVNCKFVGIIITIGAFAYAVPNEKDAVVVVEAVHGVMVIVHEKSEPVAVGFVPLFRFAFVPDELYVRLDDPASTTWPLAVSPEAQVSGTT
jgi:hypothetical protein